MKKRDNEETVSLEDWADEFTRTLADESLKLLIGEGRLRGPDVTRMLVVRYLARFIGVAVWDTLTVKSKIKLTEAEKYDFTAARYRSMKTGVQEAVAVGFQGAFTTFTNNPVEYYCQILPVPPPVNKQPC